MYRHLQLAPLAVVLLLSGCAPVSCSHTASIADASSRVSTAAVEIEKRATAIVETATSAEPDIPAIVEHASQIASHARSIRSETQTISRHVAAVQDKPSQLLDVLRWLAIAAVVVGVVFAAWRFGLDRLVYGLIALTGIPTAARREAELDRKALSADAPETYREAVAAKRRANAHYDAQFSALSRSQVKKTTP